MGQEYSGPCRAGSSPAIAGEVSARSDDGGGVLMKDALRPLHRLGPLHHASHGPPPPFHGGGSNDPARVPYLPPSSSALSRRLPPARSGDPCHDDAAAPPADLILVVCEVSGQFSRIVMAWIVGLNPTITGWGCTQDMASPSRCRLRPGLMASGPSCFVHLDAKPRGGGRFVNASPGSPIWALIRRPPRCSSSGCRTRSPDDGRTDPWPGHPS
jgi:hypothetical protein